ncbi:MAG TPA: radical SAM protein [Vicinamibacterales bacterium]
MARVPILLIAPHSRCNCRCVMCDIWRASDRRELSPDFVATWMPDLERLGVERIVLTGGEPLMHTDLFALCEPLRARGLSFTLLTTGLLLERYAPQVAQLCDEVIVSLDGPSAMHDAIRRVPGAFDRLGRGIEALRRAGPDVRIGARCTVQHANVACICETVDAAAGLALDSISFLAVDVTSTAFNRPDGWTVDRQADVSVRREDLPTLARQLDELEASHGSAFASGFIVESPEKLRRRLLWYFEALHGRRPFPAQRCNAPWVSAVVETDGTMRPCFFHRPIGAVNAGRRLEDVVNSEQARTFRRGLDVSTDPICRRCVCTLYREAGEERP